ncbi:methionine ABC transporter permease [Peptoniphilus indolicus]|uniref:Methionine ABC superfamily ATP binding cassette transporter, membrane protein n=2 Tax=Peptoniphilus indolicus TaxID=33030 RepID=G4D0X9_9FIRM|nr:methionine ABC transporter permease [Peptoniphilus indolicus]EGY80822.1 methionine ABC superfamily ATP binding cassette transporter, membrane protein [Peptoniphilus indolicus ATCC 29427]SUB74753.1 D-methionine transport system permease protein metI [Peptoniphilus indolicus]
MEFVSEAWNIVAPAIPQTLILVFVSSAIAVLLGMPLGIILTLTRPEGLRENSKLYSVLDSLVNFFRSVPFIILMLILIPLMRLVVGKAYGTAATIIPLAASAIPFFGRLMEGYLSQIDRGILEAAKSMGSTNSQIVKKVLIPEAMPQIINGITMVIINIIGYSAMAGAIGGGGLGEVAVRYGYSYKRYEILWVAVILIVALVQIIQFVGTYLENKIDKK